MEVSVAKDGIGDKTRLAIKAKVVIEKLQRIKKNVAYKATLSLLLSSAYGL